jgi:uncharacterized membrane protein YhaH (DUF805 family)
MQWYIEVLKNYANFHGRARRKEYWMFYLFNFLIIGVILFLGEASNSDFMAALLVIYYLFILVPSLSVTVRRLHDIGKSGWMVLINFVPLIGGIILLIFTCMDSEPNDNQYGPNPKVLVNKISQSQSSTSTETFCSSCGQKTPPGKFCVKCGAELQI